MLNIRRIGVQNICNSLSVRNPQFPHNKTLDVPTELAPCTVRVTHFCDRPFLGNAGSPEQLSSSAHALLYLVPAQQFASNKTQNSPSRCEWSVEGLHVTQPLLSVHNASHSLSLLKLLSLSHLEDLAKCLLAAQCSLSQPNRPQGTLRFKLSLLHEGQSADGTLKWIVASVLSLHRVKQTLRPLN